MRGHGALLATLLFAVATPALAQDACLDAYDGSQRLRREGRLIAARAELLKCAQQQCPEAVAKQCTRWLGEVNQSLPTVVFGARDAAGRDVTNVRISTRGRLLADRLDGRAVPLDPGQHTVRFEPAAGPAIDRSIVVREGEKNRLIEITLPGPATPKKPTPPADEAAKPSSDRPAIPTLAIVLGAVGVVALGSFTYFAIDAKTDVDAMEADCKPDCSADRVDTAERKALIADISLGVGLAALAGAGFVIIARPGEAQGGMITFGARF